MSKTTSSSKPSKSSNRGKAKGRESDSDNMSPALLLSAEFKQLRLSGKLLSDKLEPLGISISKYGKALVDYNEKKYTFPLDKELLRAYTEYSEALAKWQSFRDSLRVQKEARPLLEGGALAKLLESQGTESDSKASNTD